MSMSGAQAAAFQAAGGFPASTSYLLFVGFTVAISFLWGAWALWSCYRGWATGNLDRSIAAPSRGEGVNMIQTMQNYAYDGFLLLGLIICAVIFCGVAWHAFSTYHEIQLGKKKWMDLGETAAVGVAIVGVAIFLVTKATAILCTGAWTCHRSEVA